MPVCFVFLIALLLAGCAGGAGAPEPEGADRLDAVVDAQVREGRDRGYPRLANVPRPAATPADAAALDADATALEEEARVLRALREAAAEPAPPGDLADRAEGLRAEIARIRADAAAQPPIERPAPR